MDPDSDPTRLDPTLKAAPAPDQEGETVLHKPPVDDATRIAQSNPQEIEEIDSLDPPTRLMVASARRLQQPNRFAPGALIRDRFRLEKEIGRGGMGVVFTARDLRKEEVGDADSLIAIKLLSDDFKDHPDSLRMLQQETRKTQKLAHPNVVTVFDFDRDGDTVYMTMEYLTGEPLTDYIKRHESSQSELGDVLPIITDIVNGLEYAHKQGIVHSDLKPGNIFLTGQKVAKILDFGIARAVMTAEEPHARTGQAPESSTDDEATRITQPAGAGSNTEQLFALTPRYASPEMFDDAPPDARDDIYALACITYQLLTGEHPFSGIPANRARDEGLSPDPIPGLNERQWKGLLAGLAFDRETRTASAEAFLEAFLPPRKEPWRWATLGIGLLAITITAYLMTRPPEEAPLSEADQQTVDQQIEVARQHTAVGNLGVALENYKMLLALPPYDKSPPGGGFIQHPFDSVATRDLQALVETIEQEAQTAVADGRLEDAEAFVQAGLDVDRDNGTLLELKRRIEDSR